MSQSRIDQIVFEKIQECENEGIPYNIDNLYEDAEIQFSDELAREE
jgi:hypothetical protein